jgi:multiple sugar transport system permease protein/putative aldouronate transport system permease protein
MSKENLKENQTPDTKTAENTSVQSDEVKSITSAPVTEEEKEAYKKSIKEQHKREKEEEKRAKQKNAKVVIDLGDGKQMEVKAKKKKQVKSVGDLIFFFFDYLFFIIFTLSCLFPFYYLFINTISDASLVSQGLINFVPRGINIQNYVALRNVNDLGNSLIVSIARTILGTALMVMASAFVGYLVTKQEMWHRKFFYRFLVITMYFNAGLIPWYLNMSMLGLTNTFAAYIIPGIVAPYNIILVKTYIESIPAELEESAFIDGASYMRVFVSIIWPLSMPILATIAIFGAVGNWNSFQDSLILMPNAPELYTLQHRLYIYLNSSSNLGAVMNSAGSGSSAALDYANNGKIIKYTISMVSIIPILLVYPFMQRYFEEGIMLGAVKG